MLCPFCKCVDTAVRDSRSTENGAAVRRRRQCQECGARFTTFEHAQLRDMAVLKRDGQKVLFEREKLARSVRIAARKRPLGNDQIEQLVSDITRKLEKLGEGAIRSETIGSMVMQELHIADPVAYVRYASVYKDFRDPSDFARFIQQLEEEKSN